MAHIVLIQPYCGDWDEMSVRFPESLLAVAALPVSKGYSVKIIDQRICRDFHRELADVVGSETTIFGVTSITGQQIRYALEVTAYLKRTYPHIPICWGGVHATLLPDQTIAHPDIDYLVLGDGDLVFCELFERLRDKKSIDNLRGLVYKTSAGQIHSNAGQVSIKTVSGSDNYTYVRKSGSVDVIKDLDTLPPLPYHLLNFDDYNVFDLEKGGRSVTLNTSRGCPFRCKFCSGPVINLGLWRGFSSGRVLEKVDQLYRDFNVRMIYFQDDYFPGNKIRFLEILRGLRDRYHGDLRWSTLGIRADILAKLNDQELELLSASGCHSLEIGIESGNPRIIELTNKCETLEEMRLANLRLAQYDIKIKYTLIIGFPGETETEIMQTVRFAVELEKANPHAYCLIFNFLPVIGTPFYEDAIKAGFTAPTDLAGWATLDFDGWMRRFGSWATPRMVRKMEAITLVSYFHNRNVAYKFGGAAFLRFCFILYQPIANWRFRHQFFGFCIEVYLKKWLLALRSLRKKS